MKVRAYEIMGALLSGAVDGATPEERHLVLLKEGKRLARQALSEHLENGWETSPLQQAYLECLVAPVATQAYAEERVHLHRALTTDLTEVIREHHAYRHTRNGNVVWEFTGPTGSGKSSCMLGLLEDLNHVEPEELGAHLTIDVPELGNILPSLSSGSGVVVDEQSSLVGEGSLVQEKLLGNLEDQIRLTGIDLYWASPRQNREHATSQGEFQSLTTNWNTQETRFLVWLNQLPLGVATLPWCSPGMWAAYEPIKNANVQRARRATFHNVLALDEQVKRLFDHDAIQLICSQRRPKAAEWRRIIRRHGPSLGSAQVQSMAEEIVSMLDVLDNDPDLFPTLYNWEPTPNMVKAANAAQDDEENLR